MYLFSFLIAIKYNYADWAVASMITLVWTDFFFNDLIIQQEHTAYTAYVIRITRKNNNAIRGKSFLFIM